MWVTLRELQKHFNVKFKRGPGGCWLWQGKLKTGGYGPHRRAWEIAVGPIPDDLTIDHTCEVKNCCNPTHLRLLTRSENVLASKRMRHKRRQTLCMRGHPLTPSSRKGWRICRICNRAKNAEGKARREQQARDAEKPLRRPYRTLSQRLAQLRHRVSS